VNPGEIWQLDNSRNRRLVLSADAYNSSNLGRVITVVVGGPPAGFDPFAVDTEYGTVYADRIAMHPRGWLTRRVGLIEPKVLAEVRRHLTFLLGCGPH
jgi:mRNA-degrading endonuclease toxin of MazEF toxin-antitoxin module